MKKLGAFLVGASLVAGAAVWAANTATSVNVVGFEQVTLPASNKYVMVASNFEPVGGGVRTVLDIFGTNSGLRVSTVPTKVDKVYVWDLNSQSYLIIAQKPNGSFYQTSAWAGSPTNPVVPVGYGFFIQSPTAANGGTNDTTLTLAGQVPGGATNTMTIVGATPTMPYQMLANPYPVAQTIDSLINTNHGARGAASPANCDKVYLWDSASQSYIIMGLKTPTNRWFFTSAWTTNNMPVFTVSPGEAFWYQGKTNFTWNAVRPYSL